MISPCAEISSSEITDTKFYDRGQDKLSIEYNEFSVPDLAFCGEFLYSIDSLSYDQEIFNLLSDSSTIEIDISSFKS